MARKRASGSKKGSTSKGKSTRSGKSAKEAKASTESTETSAERARAAGRAEAKATARARDEKERKSRTPLIDHELMKALAHEDRVRCLAILNERMASPNQMAAELGEGVSQVSYHVKVLRGCGLIELEDEAQRRGAIEHFYRAIHRALIPADTWQGLPRHMQKGISAEILRFFFDDASAAMEADVFDDPRSHLSWTPMIVDEKAVVELEELADEMLERGFDIQAGAAERMREAGTKDEDGISATLFLSTFLSARDPGDGKKAFARLQR